MGFNIDVSVSVCYCDFNVLTEYKIRGYSVMKKEKLVLITNPNTSPPSPEKMLTIGDLAKACNATVRTLRYYEELDLITPQSRSAGGYRLYVSATIKRVNAVLALQALHYSLEEITALLGRSSEGLSTATRKRRVGFTKTTLAKQALTITEKLRSLQAMQQELEQRLGVLTTHCEPCSEEFPDKTCCEYCPHTPIHWN
jgi:DNA-binding transcriptional MerR regulator